MENVLKQSRRNTFTFEGHAIVGEKTFTIDKANDEGTWVHNSINMGIDCGDQGIHYVTMMGGYNPIGENYLQLLCTGEDGKLLPREQGFKIDFEDRLNIDFKDLEEHNVSKSNYINMYVERDNNGKTIPKTFLHLYDVVPYLKEHIIDKTPLVIRGHIDYRISTNGDVTASHVIDTITVKSEEFLNPRASLQLMVLVDKDTLGQPNLEDRNVPLYVKTITYIGKMNGKKYNQTCAVPLKILLDMDSQDIETEQGKKNFKYGVDTYYTPSKKGYVNETLFHCHYTGGVKKTEVKLEDLPKEIREGIEHGYISQEQVMGVMTNGPAPKDIVFDFVMSEGKEVQIEDIVQKIPVPVHEKAKYKESEIISFEDLEPVDVTKNVAPDDNTLEISDEELDDTATNIMNMFASLGN